MVSERCACYDAQFPFYPHIRVKWDFDPGNMGRIFN